MICDYILKDLPSYLKDLLSDTDLDKIQLVCKSKSLDNENDFTQSVSICKEEIDSENKLDVTGSPLKVPLSGNETLIIEDVRIVQTWTESETKQIPMPIQEARNYLNSRTRNRANHPVFVICDGCNPLSTVILGIWEHRNKIFTCTVSILGCFSKSDEKVALSTMEKSHLLLTRSLKCKIDYIITFKYFIFGSFLQNVKDIYSCEDSGSVCIETSFNKKCGFHNPSTLADGMKINVQVITGHRNSSLFFLWEDLMLLNNYIKVTSSVNKKIPETEICNNPLSSEDIYNNLNDIVNTSLVKRELKTEFGLNNMRLPNIIDKIWSILKNCQDLRVLREAFHFFFEELAESTSNIRLSPDTTSNMAFIINGILDGKLAVPTIDCGQALEFLIEIVAEKLKNDYQSILKNFCVSLSKIISSKWKELDDKLSVEETHRKTRITHVLKEDKTTLKNSLAKLEFLSRLHVISEFIYLVKGGAFLPEKTFGYFCEKACKAYLIENVPLPEFKNLLEKPVCNFSMEINSSGNDIVEKKIPDFCSVKMTSIKDNSEIKTIYLLSKNKIFPPNIFDDYEIVKNDESMLYYVYKMESKCVKI